MDPQARAAAVMAGELTPEQRAAKDAVKLPYEHTGEEGGAFLQLLSRIFFFSSDS